MPVLSGNVGQISSSDFRQRLVAADPKVRRIRAGRREIPRHIGQIALLLRDLFHGEPVGLRVVYVFRHHLGKWACFFGASERGVLILYKFINGRGTPTLDVIVCINTVGCKYFHAAFKGRCRSTAIVISKKEARSRPKIVADFTQFAHARIEISEGVEISDDVAPRRGSTRNVFVDVNSMPNRQ